MHRGLSTYEHCIVPPGSTNTERHYRSSVGAGEGASPAGMGMLRSTQSLEAEVDELRVVLLAGGGGGGAARQATRMPNALLEATPEGPWRAPCMSLAASPSSGSPSSTASSSMGTPSTSRWRRKVPAVPSVLPHTNLPDYFSRSL
jgi:hypothetical protein